MMSAGAMDWISGPGKAGANSSPPINPSAAPPAGLSGMVNQSLRIRTSPMIAATQYNSMAVT
jgi:hypothetical protein